MDEKEEDEKEFKGKEKEEVRVKEEEEEEEAGYLNSRAVRTCPKRAPYCSEKSILNDWSGVNPSTPPRPS